MAIQEVLATDTPNAGRTKWNAADSELNTRVATAQQATADHAALTNNPHGVAADQITNVPGGSIAAATVQAAINELDTEKTPLTDLRLTNTRTPTDASVTNEKAAAGVSFVILCTSTTRPATAKVGQLISETDTGKVYRNTGTQAAPIWTEIAGGAATDASIGSFSAYQSVSQLGLPHGAVTPINLDIEEWDVSGAFAGSTFTAPVAGKYLIGGGTFVSPAVDQKLLRLQLVNAANTFTWRILFYGVTSGVTGTGAYGSAILDLAAGDTVRLAVFHNFGNAPDTFAGQPFTWFTGHLLSR